MNVTQEEEEEEEITSKNKRWDININEAFKTDILPHVVLGQPKVK